MASTQGKRKLSQTFDTERDFSDSPSLPIKRQALPESWQRSLSVRQRPDKKQHTWSDTKSAKLIEDRAIPLTQRNEEDRGEEKSEEVEEAENEEMDRDENNPFVKLLEERTRWLKDNNLYDSVMKDPHTRADGRPPHLMKPAKGCSCASDLAVGGDEAAEATTASPAEYALVHKHSIRNDGTRARDDNVEHMTRPGHTVLPSTHTVAYGPPASSASYIKCGSAAPRPSVEQPHTSPNTAIADHAIPLPILAHHQLLNFKWTIIPHNSAMVPVCKTIHGAIVKTMRILTPRVIDNQEGPDGLLQPKLSVLEVAVIGQVVGHECNVEAVRDADVRQAFGILRDEQDADPVMSSTETSAHGNATNPIYIDDDVDAGQVNNTCTEMTEDRSSQRYGLAAPESMPGEITGWTQIPLAVYRGRHGSVVQEIICAEEVGHVNNIEAVQGGTVRRLYQGLLTGDSSNTGLPPAYTEPDGTIVKMSFRLKAVDSAHGRTEFQDVLVRRATAAEEKVASEAPAQ